MHIAMYQWMTGGRPRQTSIIVTYVNAHLDFKTIFLTMYRQIVHLHKFDYAPRETPKVQIKQMIICP